MPKKYYIFATKNGGITMVKKKYFRFHRGSSRKVQLIEIKQRSLGGAPLFYRLSANSLYCLNSWKSSLSY